MLRSQSAGFERLVTTPAVQQKMKSQHRDSAAAGKSDSDFLRSTSFFLTSASGELVLSIFLLKDSTSTDGKWVRFDADGLNSSGGGHSGRKGHIYIIPDGSQSAFDEKKWLEEVFTELVVPALEVNAQSDAEGQRPRSVMLLNGDIPQVQILDNKAMVKLFTDRNIEVGKLPAGTSMAMQPNDVMRAHALLKAWGTKIDRIPYIDDLQSMTTPTYYSDFHKWVNNESKLMRTQGSKNLIQQFFCRAPTVLARSFSVAVVQKGWEKTGFSPFNMETTMSGCSSWAQMSKQTTAQVWNAMDAVTIHFAEHDWTTENIMDEYHIPITDGEAEDYADNVNAELTAAKKKKKSLNELSTWRQRAVCLTGCHFMVRRRQKIIADEAAEVAKQENKALQATEKERQKAAALTAKKQKEEEIAAAKIAKQQEKEQKAADAAARKLEEAKARDEQKLKVAAERATVVSAQKKKRKAESSACNHCSAEWPTYEENQQRQWTECPIRNCFDPIRPVSKHGSCTKRYARPLQPRKPRRTEREYGGKSVIVDQPPRQAKRQKPIFDSSIKNIATKISDLETSIVFIMFIVRVW